jgi:hypothetical protein
MLAEVGLKNNLVRESKLKIAGNCGKKEQKDDSNATTLFCKDVQWCQKLEARNPKLKTNLS